MNDEFNADPMIGDDPLVPVDPEVLRKIEEAARDEQIKKLMDMKALVSRLSGERDELIKAKRPIETMMLDSQRLFRGDDCYEDATKSQPVNSDTTRAPRPKLLRARTERWAARMVEMLSANPWGLEPDCDPKAKEQDPTLEARLQKACDGMELTIRNQLEWCKFGRSIRKMCMDAAQLGTGLLMGPRKSVRTKRKYSAPQPQTDWQQQGFVPQEPNSGSRMMTEESIVPEITEADPFCFFPDLTERAEKAEKAFYVHFMGRMEVQNLAPGFDEFQINALLRTEPDIGAELKQNLSQRMLYLDNTNIYKDRYAVWRYTGVLGRKDLEILGLCGCDSPDDGLGNPEPVDMAMADIWFCQDFILRARLAPVPDDFRIPYYVFAPFPIEGSMFGLSLPMMGVDSNRVACAAWLMALHNQSVSSGALIVMKNGSMKPADQQWSIRGPKVMYKTDDTPMAELINVFNTPNESEGALRIMDRAISLMDEELNTLQWASEEGAEEHDTASGLAMIYNVRSILQGMVAACADDEVFDPVIQRMVWWNNDNNEDEGIKGDYLVNPLVQSERLVKDVRAQQCMAFTQMTDNPRWKGMVRDRKLLEMNVANMDGQFSDVMVPESEYLESLKNQPPDPAMLQAQLLATKAETEKLRAERETILAQTEQIKQQMAMLELQSAQNPQVDNSGAMGDLALKQRDLELKDKKIDADLLIAQERTDAQREATAQKAEQSRLEAAEFAYEKQQDRQARLMTEGMKIERDAKEMQLKRDKGSGI